MVASGQWKWLLSDKLCNVPQRATTKCHNKVPRRAGGCAVKCDRWKIWRRTRRMLWRTWARATWCEPHFAVSRIIVRQIPIGFRQFVMHLCSSRKLKTCYVNADSNRWRVACRAVSSARRTSSWCVIHHLWWSSTSLGAKSVPKAKAATRFGLFCHFLFRIFSNLFRISSSFFFHILFHVCINDILCNIILIFRNLLRIFSLVFWFAMPPCWPCRKSRNEILRKPSTPINISTCCWSWRWEVNSTPPTTNGIFGVRTGWPWWPWWPGDRCWWSWKKQKVFTKSCWIMLNISYVG